MMVANIGEVSGGNLYHFTRVLGFPELVCVMKKVKVEAVYVTDTVGCLRIC